VDVLFVILFIGFEFGRGSFPGPQTPVLIASQCRSNVFPCTINTIKKLLSQMQDEKVLNF
jgi:hypothetical protein